MSRVNFVISAPRSGSTWLATALNAHPEIFATEHRLFGNFHEVWRNNDGTHSPRMTFDYYARAFAVHYFHNAMGLSHADFVSDFLREYAQFLVQYAEKKTGKSVVVDKITPYPGTSSYVVRQIRTLFPESKIVLLVRDGRDVLTSGTFDWLLKDAEGTDRYQFFVQPAHGVKLKRFFDSDVIAKWATHWIETVQWSLGEKSKVNLNLSAANVAQVHYEAMKHDMPGQLEKLFQFMGVESSTKIASECSESATFEKMSGRAAGDADPLAKARKGIVGDWRNYFTYQDGFEFDQIAGGALVMLGYEKNRRWYQELPRELELEC